MWRSPFKPPSPAALLFLLCASPVCAQSFIENHPGLWVEWLQMTNNPIEGSALADADGDGDLDLFVVDGTSLELWRNNGRGDFTVAADPISLLPVSSVLALDLDGDSRTDLVVALDDASGGVAVMKGLGGGQFGAPELSPTGTKLHDLNVLGVDSHGARTIVASEPEPGTGFHVLVQDGNGFRIAQSLLPDMRVYGLATADLNADGFPDIVVGGRSTEAEIAVFLGTGGGLVLASRFPHQSPSMHIAPVDLDGDGDLDLVTADDIGFGVFIGDGTGTSWIPRNSPIEDAGGYTPTVLAADMDGDGRSELFLAYGQHEGALLSQFECVDDPQLLHRRDISYMHGEISGVPPDRLIAGDLNGDHRSDLVLINEYAGYPNNGTGRGKVGVLLSRPDGRLGGISFHEADVPASRVISAHLRPSGPAALVLSGPSGSYLTSLIGDDLAPSVRIGDGSRADAADLDHDGRDDLLLQAGEDELDVRITARDGTPGPVSARIEGSLLGVGTVDPDRRPDLLIRRPDGAVEILWGHPKGDFRRATGTGIVLPEYGSHKALLADIDGDGRDELIECRVHNTYPFGGHAPDTLVTYRILPNGRIHQAGRTIFDQLLPDYSDLVAVDAANLDAKPGDELVLETENNSSNGSFLVVLKATGDGQYSAMGPRYLGGESPGRLWLADLDGDGDIDAACSAGIEGFIGLIHVRWNDGTGNLTGQWSRRISSSRVVETTVGDVDGDGIPDLALLTPPDNRPFEDPTRVAFVFGRRDEVSAAVSDLTFESVSSGSIVPTLAIRDISPNPSRNEFAIRWTARPDEPVTIELHDVAGRRVRSEQLQGAGEAQARFESLSDLPAGLYWIRIRQGNAVATKRVALIR